MNTWGLKGNIKKSYSFTPGNDPFSSSRIGDIIDESAEKYGDNIAIISTFQNVSKTYSEFGHEVERLASGFISIGLRKDDRIAIFAPNCYEWLLTQWASAKAGLIMVNINLAFKSIELGHCLEKVDCKALISTENLLSPNFYEMVCGIDPNIPKDRHGKLQCSRLPKLESIVLISEERKNGILNFKDVLGNGNKESDKMLSEIENSIQFDDPVTIQFTSGTTGEGKMLVHTHHSVVNTAIIVGRKRNYHIQRPIACCFPLYHSVGYVLSSLATIFYGGTIVIPSPEFNAVLHIEAIETHECSDLDATPSMIFDYMRHHQSGKFNTASLKRVKIIGAACTLRTLKNIKDVFVSSNIAIEYGSTETNYLANTSIEHFDKSFEYLEPIAYVEVKIINDAGQLVPVNTRGEICTRGFNTFQGYWDDATKTAEVFDKARWFHTGDLGVMNDKGLIKIEGRVKDVIIRGGEKIYPSDIENFLNSHPSIQEIHICGVPDKILGEEACAWICLQEGMHMKEEEVKEFCKGKINTHKIPRYVMFVKDFPKTPAGKIKKFEMAKISIEKLALI